MSELKELIEKYIEIEDEFDGENEEIAEKLHELGHEIDHTVFHEEFIIVSNATSEDKEVVALIISDEEDELEEYVIPVYTDDEEAKEAIEIFKEEFGENEFICDKKIGNEIVADHAGDEGFLGLAINAPQFDFLIFSEDVHDCSE